MGSVTLTGNDTTIIGGRIFTDFADGDAIKLTFPDNVAEITIGKNGNTIYAFNAKGLKCEAELRLLRGSQDDKYLNNLQKSYLNDPPTFSPPSGEFIKRIGDGKGNVTNDAYIFAGGMPTKLPEARENVGGETEQAVTIWKIVFPNTNRSMG